MNDMKHYIMIHVLAISHSPKYRNKINREAKQLDLLLPCQIFQEIHK